MTDVDLGQFPAPYPHESLRELGPDVFFLAGCMRMAPLMRISRNMTVVRQDGELVVFNAVRMSPAAEAELNQLGRVTHVVRLGSFHGLDDAYYVARYGAQFWCQRESTHYPEPAVNHELSEGGALPLPDAELFVFRETKRPECALLLKHGAGLLITCDSVQHYGDFGRHSLPAKLVMRTAGFHKGML
ncbi:MAG: hypothetical protein QNJ73_06885, partial [Gammaproteobacteria bacterium]|nr:hypothetical protein [Gammaproteobacteria bacterium]